MQNHNNIRSFARRIGKSLSNTQKDLLRNTLPNFKFELSELSIQNKEKKINIEIGIGMAEHFMHNAFNNPDEIFIGFEPYLNGIANALRISRETDITNIRLFPDDADLILNQIPENVIDKIFILFPDPWPKTKQNKKRFLNLNRLNLLIKILKHTGQIIFASDIDDYFNDCFKHMNNSELKNISKDNFEPHDGYIKTKYNQKADLENRHSRFMIFEKQII